MSLKITWAVHAARQRDRLERTDRTLLRRVLSALVEARLQQPGVSVSIPHLIERGWPDQQPSYESGQNRVYVTVNELRKLGLKDVLATGDDGYLLRTDCEVVLAQPTDAS